MSLYFPEISKRAGSNLWQLTRRLIFARYAFFGTEFEPPTDRRSRT